MDAYYYAGGRKVELERDDEHVAVERTAAEQAGLDSDLKTGSAAASHQGSSVILARRSALPTTTLASLRTAGALQPVYKRGEAVVVALPEVRVEFDNPEQRRDVMKMLAESGTLRHTIDEETSDGLVVRPASGNGADALTLANEIHERAKPAAASVRFVQFVPKPGTVRT